MRLATLAALAIAADKAADCAGLLGVVAAAVVVAPPPPPAVLVELTKEMLVRFC